MIKVCCMVHKETVLHMCAKFPSPRVGVGAPQRRRASASPSARPAQRAPELKNEEVACGF